MIFTNLVAMLDWGYLQFIDKAVARSVSKARCCNGGHEKHSTYQQEVYHSAASTHVSCHLTYFLCKLTVLVNGFLGLSSGLYHKEHTHTKQ